MGILKKSRGDDEVEKTDFTHIWRKYQQGVSYIHKIGLVEKTDKAHRFYIGEQWYGLKSGGDALPMFNFIKPIIRFKVSTVCQKAMTAIYSPFDIRDEQEQAAATELGRYFDRMWELGKMDRVCRKVIKDAAIAGDAYLFFGEGDDIKKGQIIDNVNLFLGDEKNEDIQSQPYIIIRERRFVRDIIDEARANGISDGDISLITSDDDVQDQLGEKTDIEYGHTDGKCVSLLYIYKDEEGYIHSAKSTKNVIYQPDRGIYETYEDEDGNTVKGGLTSYPIVNFIWETRKNSARGVSEVEQLIPNQLEVNKTLARRSLTVKQAAYPKLIYNGSSVMNVQDLEKVGAVIEVTDAQIQGVNNIIGYLNPAAASPDAKNLSDELIITTRELAGAGDAAMGNINPEQASGNAIIAVRDQAVLPLNEQTAAYRQFVEDIALLWFDIWRAYNPNGIREFTEQGEIFIPAEVLERLRVNVKIDVCDKDAYSRYAEEQSLGNLFNMQAITFEEYVDTLSDDSIVPKAKLKNIIAKRQERALEQQALMQGGMGNEMQGMRGGDVPGLGGNGGGLQDLQVQMPEQAVQ